MQVSWNTQAVLRQLTDVQRKQIPFAAQLALNRTQEERQQRLTMRIETTLTIRGGGAKSQFKRIVQFPRADRADKTVGKQTATLRILGGNAKATAPVLQRLSSIVLRQDQGGPQSSAALYRAGSLSGATGAGSRFVTGGFALPAPGLRSATKGVSRALYPYALGLTTQRAIAGGTQFNSQYKGGKKKRGTGFKKNTRYYFVKEGVGIFVRTQVGKESEYDAVWFFRQRITLPRRLQLEETFYDGLEKQLETNFRGFLEFALRTAK